MLQHVYGYVPMMGRHIEAEIPLSWKHIPSTLGFISNSSFAEVLDQDKDGIRLFIHCLLKNYENIPRDLDGLNDQNFASLGRLPATGHLG